MCIIGTDSLLQKLYVFCKKFANEAKHHNHALVKCVPFCKQNNCGLHDHWNTFVKKFPVNSGHTSCKYTSGPVQSGFSTALVQCKDKTCIYYVYGVSIYWIGLRQCECDKRDGVITSRRMNPWTSFCEIVQKNRLAEMSLISHHYTTQWRSRLLWTMNNYVHSI